MNILERWLDGNIILIPISVKIEKNGKQKLVANNDKFDKNK